MLSEDSEEDVPALDDVGFAPELRFADSLPLEVLSTSPELLEYVVLISSALLEDVTSVSSALLPLSPHATNVATRLNVAKSEKFFIY